MHLAKYDAILLHRNNIVAISVVVTIIYAAVFRALSALGDMEKLLVLIIFNDPALLGFLFVGVMVLFEKNENTLQALAVSPVSLRRYILSKSLVLTFIAVLCCFGMAVAGYGWGFHVGHFAAAATLSTLLFSFLGFVAVAGQSSFNRYILRAVGGILFVSLPFVGYFGLVPHHWFVLFPTQPVIDLFGFAFADSVTSQDLLLAYGLSVGWCLLAFRAAEHLMAKNFGTP